jgi:hypothetical protein
MNLANAHAHALHADAISADAVVVFTRLLAAAPLDPDAGLTPSA